MDKIKMDYILLSKLLFFTTFQKPWGVATPSQLPFILLILSGVVIYFYVLDMFTKWGYFVSDDGISFYQKNAPSTISWANITVEKDFFGQKVVLNNGEKNFYIDTSCKKSIIVLTEKYCLLGILEDVVSGGLNMW